MSSVSLSTRSFVVCAILAISTHLAFAGPGVPAPTPSGPTFAANGPGVPAPTPSGPTFAAKGPGVPAPTPSGPTMA